MRGNYKLRVLEFLKDAIYAADDVFFIFTLPYGTSYSRMRELLERRLANREKIVPGNEKQTKRRFSDFVYRLKKDGLIAERKKEKDRFLALTSKGRAFLNKVISGKLPSSKYMPEGEDELKIIIFDIPEKEKRKREWLRWALKNLNFKMIQKSVWLGKAKLPQQFIDDLGRINMLSYVEIFAITKKGSLRQTIKNI